MAVVRKLRALHLLAFLTALFTANHARGQEEWNDNQVHSDLMPYLVVGGLTGDLTVASHTTPIDKSASDLFNHLQFGFMSRTHVSYNRFFMGADLMYVGLGGSTSLVNVGVDQWTGEALAGYRVTPTLKLFAGTRYNNTTTRLRFQGPLGTLRSGSVTWWDPIVGWQEEFPFADVFSFSARFDVGGFSVGSRLAINAEPLLNLHNNKHVTTSIGWKFLYQNYVDSSRGFEYDALMQGPMAGLTIRF